AADTLSALAKNITATRYLSNTGASNNPAWAQIDLTNGVTGILPTANGGTGMAFFTAAGPTVARTYTFPDAAATVLTSNAAVTVGQGGTGLAASVSDAVLVGDSTSAYTARTLPASCAVGATSKLLYDSTTNLFSCGTDQTGGGSTMTTVVTKNASGLGTGANAAVAMTSLTARKVALFNIPYSITVNQLTYNVGAVTTAGTIRFCVYDEAGTTKLIDVTDVPAAGANPVTVGAVTLTPGNYYIAFGCATTCSNTVFMFTSTANTVVNTSAVPTGKKEYEGLYTMTSGTCNTTIDPTAFTGTISHTPVIRLDN
ncbi:MAG: hypothetical protein AAB886_01195, partial [Patescibacteria group bacterium]